jgi:hypothetical protein
MTSFSIADSTKSSCFNQAHEAGAVVVMIDWFDPSVHETGKTPSTTVAYSIHVCIFFKPKPQYSTVLYLSWHIPT